MRVRASVAVLAVAISLFAAPPAVAQRRAGDSRSVTGTMQAGLAAGVAGVEMRRRASWDAGPLLGARWRWSGERSGAVVALDVQPFVADGDGSSDAHRAAWLLPAWEFRRGSAGIRAGLGIGMYLFEEARFGDRRDFTMMTGVSGSIRLPASFALELAWRRTGFVREFRFEVLSLQLIRFWRL